jgi:hypothetical protein
MDPGLRRDDSIETIGYYFVIPAQAGIQAVRTSNSTAANHAIETIGYYFVIPAQAGIQAVRTSNSTAANHTQILSAATNRFHNIDLIANRKPTLTPLRTRHDFTVNRDRERLIRQRQRIDQILYAVFSAYFTRLAVQFNRYHHHLPRVTRALTAQRRTAYCF